VAADTVEEIILFILLSTLLISATIYAIEGTLKVCFSPLSVTNSIDIAYCLSV